MTTTLQWSGRLGTVDPVELPLANLTIILRNAVPSFHSATVPYSTAVVEALVARPTDTVRLLRGGTEWGFFNRGTDAIYEGSQSSSIVLTGYRQQTYASPVTVTIERSGISELRTLSSGAVSGYVHPDLGIRPNDTLTIGAVSYLVSRLDYSLSPGRSRLKLTMTEV